jgi:hypothetical protein
MVSSEVVQLPGRQWRLAFIDKVMDELSTVDSR